jgi:hypothetical protein
MKSTGHPAQLLVHGTSALAALTLLHQAALAQDVQPSTEEMWRIIQQQQKEIEELKSHQSATDEKVDATADRVEEVGTAQPSGGMVEGWWNKTSVGGYGELHYNGGRTDDIDFHRFVLFFAHQFNERMRFFSEVELEHAWVADTQTGERRTGEVELEQAYLEFDLTDRLQAKAGLFLLPIGILNETHEPPTFFGVERNNVETAVIPTTWWEGGVGGRVLLGAGFSADLAVHSGLEVSPTTFIIRGGRQKVSNARAEDPAVTGRVKWTGLPGVELAVAAQYQDDLTQGAATTAASATLVETHAAIRRGPWWFRALYARWDIDSDAATALGRDEQYGWYIEPGYIFTTSKGDLGFFARYSQVDSTAGDAADSKARQTDVGVNYWPHPQIVLKADYQIQDLPTGQVDDDRINLGVGFMF